MLYVFFVDTGTMLHLDMNLALDTVENLKQNISKQFRIPEEKQVLLISGGENLEAKARVCSYSAGTDTNPIYLFSRSTLEGDENPPIPSTEFGTDTDLSEQVEASLNMPPTYTTVVSRAQLALELYDQANRIIKDCEKLVHQQHMQQQGWAAVVANLEDTTKDFRSKSEKFEEMYNSYLNGRAECVHLLQNFSQDLSVLAKIPVLPALVSEDGDASTSDFLLEQDNNSLLSWISSKDNQSSLEQVADVCIRGLNQFDENTFREIQVEIASALERANNSTMKEVKGLEERLSGLEQLMHESKLKVQEQKDQATAFQQNQARAGNLGDPSILPDLCSSHRKQLQVMQKTHQQLRDIRRRCIRAKEELSLNLHARLRWITYVERSMCEVNSKLMFYHENLKRLGNNLKIVRQIHLAPRIYLAAVAEVVRRSSFSKQFLQWATCLSQQTLEMHTKEVSVRKAFYSQINSHFLQTLFRGMEDYPPPFATQAPLPFDINLPPISRDDLEQLRQLLPDLAHNLHMTEVGTMPTIDAPFTFSSGGREGTHRGTLSASAPILTVACTADQNIGDKEDAKGFVKSIEDEEKESEAETDEFEKVDSMPEVTDRTLFEIPEDDDNEGSTEAKQRRVETESSVVPVSQRMDVSGFVSAVADYELDEEQRAEEGDVPPPLTSPAGSCCAVSSSDFITAEFYIDESMPSSYTESNGTMGPRTTGWSGGVGGGHSVKSHHVIVAELQRHLEEKNATITSLQTELTQHQTRLQVVEGVLQTLYTLEREKTAKLHSDIAMLRQEITDQKDDLKLYISHAWLSFAKAIAGVTQNISQEQDAAINAALVTARLEHEQLIGEFQMELDKERSELIKTREQVQDLKTQLENATSRLMECEAKAKERQEQREEEAKQMVLEHELELDNAKEEHKEILESKENELKDLKKIYKNLELKLLCLEKELNQVQEKMSQRFNQEKDEIVRVLKEEKNSAVEKTVRERNEAFDAEIERLRKEWEAQLLSSCQAAVAEATSALKMQTNQKAQEDHQAEIKRLTEELESKHSERVSSLELHIQHLDTEMEERERRFLLEAERSKKAAEEETERRLSVLRTQLNELHEKQLEEVRSRFRPLTGSFESVVPDCPSTLTLESPASADFGEHQTMDTTSETVETIESLRHKHALEMEELKCSLKEKQQLEVESLRASLLAEKQVSFNEALNKVITEKDRIIDEQKEREEKLLRQQESDRVLMQKLAAENRKLIDLEQELQKYKELDQLNRLEVDRLDLELVGAQKKIEHLTREYHVSTGEAAGGLTTSVMPLESQERLLELENTLRFREEEMAKLQNKLMELSMTSSAATLLQQDKVSVLTCNTGDLVLLCYNDKHENYLAFLLGPVYHFLHTDCLEVLGLKPVSGEGRSWVLAEITEKEYCQAKKAQNRYRVPLGTKFYRVRAKPWNKDPNATSRINRDSRRSISGTSSVPSSPTASQ